MRLLVVEDSDPIRFGLADYFAARGFVVDSAASLAEALSLLASQRYDLVITDLRLSDASPVEGYDVIAEVQSKHSATRVVLLTAYRSPVVDLAATGYGAHLILQKPIRLPDLESAALELLAPVAG